MSPKNRVAGAAQGATPAAVVDGRETTEDHQLEEKSAVPAAALDKMLAMLGDLTERMGRMESSQREQVGGQRMKSAESSVFGSVLGSGAGITLQALERTPPPKRSPNVSPATYFGARRPALAGEHMVDAPAQANVNHGMARGLEPGIQGHAMPAGVYPGMQVPGPVQHQPGQVHQGVPDGRQRKLALQPFDGKELYHGLGSGFIEWGKEFVRQVAFSERACGFGWPEDIKVDVLGQHLAGTAQKYYRRQVETWWSESQTLEYAMQRLLQTFSTKITPAQSMKLFTAAKSPQRSWTEHFLYLTAVSDACGGADNLVLDNIVHYADPAIRTTMLSRLNLNRIDYLRQAEELAQFAQSTELEVRVKHFGRDVVNIVEPNNQPKKIERTKKQHGPQRPKQCHLCGSTGHLKMNCPKGTKKKQDADFVLALPVHRSISPSHWVLDSGSGRHLINDLSLLEDAVDCNTECFTAASDSEPLRITKQGSVMIRVKALGLTKTIRLLDVQYASNLECNIISFGKLESKGCILEYREGRRVMVSQSGGLPIMDVDRINSVLVVEVFNGATTNGSHGFGSPREAIMTVVDDIKSSTRNDAQHGTLFYFHNCLGHLCYDTIIKMARDPASGIKLTDTKRVKCLACAQGKQTKNRQSRKDSGLNSPIDVIGGVVCSDLKGPMTPRDRLGNRYLINFIDHRSNYCRVFLAKTKDAAAMHFKNFLVVFERKFNCRIHVLRTDGGGEYKPLDVFCKEVGVSRQVSERDNQASNGKAERMHRTIMNMVRSMVFASGLPLTFWGDAAEYAAYILNRSPTKANEGSISPIEMLTKKTPVLSDIVVFGSSCTVHRTTSNKSLGPRGKQGIIIGKNDEMKGYRVFIPMDHVVVVTQHVKNVETLDSIQRPNMTKTLHGTEGQEELGDQGGTSKSSTRPSEWTRDPHMTRSRRNDEDISSEVTIPSEGVDIVNAVRDPKNYGEAVRSDSKDKWAVAIKDELDALEENGVWAVVVPPDNAHILHNKWVFKTKTDADGNVERYKARLVACGNEQLFGVDYTLTFAAVMELGTVKVILVLSRRWNVPARHGDVPNAYVKADQEKDLDIYMKIPSGMQVNEDTLAYHGVDATKQLALLLKKSLYGLKQAGRLWSKLLHSKLTELNFKQCTTDMCLYVNRTGTDVTVVGVYVDDLLVTGTSNAVVGQFFKDMASLEIKDLGIVNKFLGLRVKLNENEGYVLDQEVTIDSLLKEHGLATANGVRSPIGNECNDDDESNSEPLKLTAKDRDASIKAFQSLVGSLLWIARCTRPDICFAVHRATRQTHKPTVKDWRTAKRVARYLKETKTLKLYINSPQGVDVPIKIESWSDADFAADKSDRKSVTGYVLTMDGAVVSWACKKQTGVSLSTMEAEFIAASHAGRELLGLKELFGELNMKIVKPMPMWMDNQAAINLLKTEKSSSSAKHVDIRFKFICHYAQAKEIEPRFIKSEEMIADLLTKALPAPRMKDLRAMFKLKTPPDTIEEEC